MTYQRRLLRATALAICLTSAPAWAQEVAPATTESDIIVTGVADRQLLLDAETETGSRLGLTVRETPAIVDILSQELMQERGLRTTVEALNATPGASSGELASSPGQLSMRGFTAGAISLLYDGVRQTNSALIIRNMDSWSFERIEVLKGPAGVLYGEGSLAGAVNLVPKKPRFSGDAFAATAGYGSFGTARAGADANLALSDAVAVRGVASINRTDGFVDDTDARFLAATLGVSFRPVERLSIELAADYLEDKYGTAYWGAPLVAASAARDPSGLVQSADGFVIDQATRRTNYNVTNADQGADAWWLRSRIDYELTDWLTLMNQLSYYDANRRFRNSEVYTYTAPNAAFPNGSLRRSTTWIDHDHQFFVERAVFAADFGIGGHRNRLSVGAEYSDSKFDSVRRFGNTTAVDLFDPQRGTLSLEDSAANFPGAGNRANFDSRTEIRSIFAENAFNLTPSFLLVGGIRYDDIRLDRVVADLNAGTVTPFTRTYKAVSWRAGAVYDLAPKAQLFAQYTRAVAPVGSLALISATNARFNLTKGKSVEGGLKASLWNDRVDLTLAAYWLKQDDIITRDPANTNLSVQGGSQSSRGIELSTSTAVTEQFRFDASLAVLNAKFDTLLEAGGVNRAGNTPPVVPERVASLFAIYRPAALPITLTAGARHMGHFYTDNANSIRVRAATIIDASIGYRLPFGEVTLRGRNLTDRLYANWFGGSARQLTLAAPRSVDLSFTARF
ncbi:TonB-dependent receptor [Sphingobium chlorophenolicum L-1]|uniref:TonB-dependent receptor n=1 Tax=Sphingobium chlorophenolicum L-1 TaxID=690566 RepID=F6EUF7_SPHCR|nr:TonB-dependent receptor [Sphingobium chlorophenolicum]AEG47851.1 TonB-dependent receptor [Sphingobium chlorophenolicum L-1]